MINMTLLDLKGIKPNKKLGQNFLINKQVLSREVSYLDCDGKNVLEIGGGTGNLSELLAQKSKSLLVLEKDSRLIPILKERLKNHPNVEIANADFLEYEIKKIDRIISNVPYSIASPLTFKLVEIDFGLAILCYQKEFALRMVAKPNTKDYSRLSVMSQIHFTPKILEIVPKSVFYPVPKVDSAIVQLIPTKNKTTEFESKIISLLFQHKNKRVRNALIDSSSQLKLSKSKLQELTKLLSFKERKVVSLSKEELLKICKEWEDLYSPHGH